jgi:hypothetical protein
MSSDPSPEVGAALGGVANSNLMHMIEKFPTLSAIFSNFVSHFWGVMARAVGLLVLVGAATSQDVPGSPLHC